MDDNLQKHLDGRFDRIEDKLDNHLDRLSKAEEAIEWTKGHLKISTTFVLGTISTIIVAYFKYLQ